MWGLEGVDMNDKEIWKKANSLKAKIAFFKFIGFIGIVTIIIFSIVTIMDINVNVSIPLVLVGMIITAFGVIGSRQNGVVLGNLISTYLKPYIDDEYARIFDSRIDQTKNPDKRNEFKEIFDKSGVFPKYNEYGAYLHEEVTLKGTEFKAMNLVLKGNSNGSDDGAGNDIIFAGVVVFVHSHKDVSGVSDDFYESLSPYVRNKARDDVKLASSEDGIIAVALNNTKYFSDTNQAYAKGVHSIETLKSAITNSISQDAAILDIIRNEFA